MKPSIGRVVWYYEHGQTQFQANEQPCSAQVAYVHSDVMINIGYLDHNGVAKAATSVRLLDAGENMPEGDQSPFCMWMPYQVQQAAKDAK